MIEKSITTKRGTVHYWVSHIWDEKRETMFFFHGLTADHTMFEQQWRYFMEKYNIIAWDAPCHGNSRPYPRFDYEDTSKIILQILEENHVSEMIAVGQSLGGYYIQAFIACYPFKVKAFVGIGTTPYGKKYYSKSATYTKAGYENMMNMITPYSKREYCHLMQIAYTAFLEDNKDLDITCPVLITYGEYDKVGKVRQYCEMWHKETRFPLVKIKDAGHNANVDNPDEMNQVIENFLNQRG